VIDRTVSPSGAVTIPEMLRLAPNLQVYQQSPAQWVVTARGLNGNPGLQSFSNKLLVLVDGRTVYAPHFSGGVLGPADVLPDDIERIEVISGRARPCGAPMRQWRDQYRHPPRGIVGGRICRPRGGGLQQAAGLRSLAR